MLISRSWLGSPASSTTPRSESEKLRKHLQDEMPTLALTAVPLAATIQIFIQELTKARREKVAEARVLDAGHDTAPAGGVP